MSRNPTSDPVIEQIERLLVILKHERASRNDAPPRPVRPIRTWDQQTRHLRFADKVKLHRYPGGLANTTRWRRDQMVAAHRTRTEGLGEAERAQAAAIHEALAYAIDAERFLGSLDQRDERDYFPVEAVDQLAVNLLVWLEERGYQTLPLERG